MSFPVITKTKKKEITAYWNNIFPEMGVYKPMWLMNILGPFAVGLCLEIQSNRDTYYPKLHFHNLMEKQGDMSLEMIVEKPAYRITTVSKEEKVIRIMRELKNNIFIPTEGNIRYYDLITKMKDFCQQTYADEQLWTLELLLYLARWTGSQEEEDNCLKFCEKIYGQEKLKFIADDDKDWITRRLSEIADTETLKKTVIQEKEKFGLSSLPQRELIYP